MVSDASIMPMIGGKLVSGINIAKYMTFMKSENKYKTLNISKLR